MEHNADQRVYALSIFAFLCLSAAYLFLAFQVGPIFTMSSSYWLDELYSVRLVDQSYFQMLREASRDVHPPLYYSLLWFWSQVFGLGEVATRSISVLSMAATIAVLVLLKEKLSRASLAFLFLLTLLNPVLHFYVLETRSYAFMVFLSTLVIVCWIRGWMWLTILACAALGSAHYFGTLVALIYLARLVIQSPTTSVRLGAAFFGVAILVWPVFQLTVTNVGDLTGGNFWIQTQGLDVFVYALDATLPALSMILDSILDQLGDGASRLHPFVVILVFLSLLLPAMLLTRNSDPEMQIAADAALIVVIVVLAVFLVGFHTPLATTRNFLVLVPHMGLVTAILCRRFACISIWRSALVAGALAVYVLLSSVETKEELENRVAPRENWREMAKIAFDATEKDELKLGMISGVRWINDVHAWYLPDGVELLAYDPDADWTNMEPSAIMFYNLGCMRGERVRNALAASGRTFVEFGMSQSRICDDGNPNNVVFVVGAQ